MKFKPGDIVKYNRKDFINQKLPDGSTKIGNVTLVGSYTFIVLGDRDWSKLTAGRTVKVYTLETGKIKHFHFYNLTKVG